ncbi:MAG: hypothetical protein JKX91_09460 [Rhizobiaceae bacterium]|nr:hypothetical protein [Rhizobiaceae bacterium]
MSDCTTVLGAGIKFTEAFEISHGIFLSPAKIEHNHIELMDRTNSKHEFGIICSLSDTITFELDAPDPDPKAAAVKLWNSQWLVVFLSCIIRKPVFDPIQKLQVDGKVSYKLTNVHFSNRIFQDAHIFTSEEKDFSLSHVQGYLKINDSRFLHAASVAAHVHNEPKFSIRIIAIWSAIEALLGVDHELSFRISLLCARLLGNGQNERKVIFKETKKLHSIRSMCVHGSYSDNKKIDQALAEEQSLKLLTDLIFHFCRRESLLEKSEQTELLLQ